ncbi:MAG: hypothetical protein Kow0037_02840 [Calditrichia bacterium]
MNLLLPIWLPLVVSLFLALIPSRIKFFREAIALLTSFYYLYFVIGLFTSSPLQQTIPWFQMEPFSFDLLLHLTPLAKFMLPFAGLFVALVLLYSFYYFRGRQISHFYYPFVLMVLSGTSLIILSDSLFWLMVGWDITTLLLFFLISMSRTHESAMAAGKSFALLGFTDVALLLAVSLVPLRFGTWEISALQIAQPATIDFFIFFLILTAAVAKAGSWPFHSWIPEASLNGPLPVVALLPATLDKLLGIYLLAVLTLHIFTPTASMLTAMLVLGAITLISANLMALFQENLKKFLGFATVAQVGFMLIGFGTGTVVGIIGGLFHMLNHAIYKSLLFFGIGRIERETGTVEMEQLGGLAKTMPFVFILMTIGVFAASGVPPFNAFVSKWLIYQGVLLSGKPVILILAMFGSSLTLATFLKMWYSCFFGDASVPALQNDTGGTFFANLSMLVPGLLCIFFGIFATFPIQSFILPVLKSTSFFSGNSLIFKIAYFQPGLAAAFLIIGLFIGALILAAYLVNSREVSSVFLGGEKYRVEVHRTPAGHLFESLYRVPFVGGAIKEGQKGIFDIYYLSSEMGLQLVNILKKAHDGVLSTYLAWCVIGLGIISFVLLVY